MAKTKRSRTPLSDGKLTFGKNADKLLKDVPADYIRWLFNHNAYHRKEFHKSLKQIPYYLGHPLITTMDGTKNDLEFDIELAAIAYDPDAKKIEPPNVFTDEYGVRWIIPQLIAGSV